MHGRVVTTERLTPGMVRVVLGGDGLAGFTCDGCTDAYVNVAIPPAGAPYAAPFDVAEVTAGRPRGEWPARRRYTVRSWDADRRLLTLDVVVHGDAGVGGPWAANARPGDVLVFTGPGGGYRPDPAADWHLLAGDESALPAIAASLEAVPAGAPVVVRVVVDGPEHEIPLPSSGALDLVWLHRSGTPQDADLLPAAVRALPAWRGRLQAFVHGEAGEVREVRRHLLTERGATRADLSCSPYWRRTMTDEAWRQVKAAWTAEVERDVA
ncbi:siderophore-interacting protein [Geodermatophilus sp. DSM 44513]|uniref:siderophore-interacting protein n=1 Tax=Geodermatophilus sp. DSM 44513 TaxID=1528104 RepID=UPI001281DE86|nr:siderophore-interacting protein [Geodermatophilus sp. DSM 44513]WNV77644.1 siderophore-interacting protein [Geodermatophilus sp. DSM 44513]